MHRMAKEIRLAGFDPMKDPLTPKPGILRAQDTVLEFTSDIAGGDTDLIDNDEDGTVNEADEAKYGNGAIGGAGERIVYQIVNDGGGTFGRLQRDDVLGGGVENLYENTDLVDLGTNEMPLNFVYYDEDGVVLPTPVVGAALEDIRSVEISLILRAVNEDFTYTNTRTFNNGEFPPTQVLSAQNDNFYRRQYITRVNVRNIGL